MKTVQEKLYHFEETPPPGLWDSISNKLDSVKVVQLHKRNRVRIIALTTAAAAAITLILINYVFVHNNRSDKPAVASSTFTVKPDTNINMEENNEALESIINAPANQKLIAGKIDSGLKYITISGPEGTPVKISPKAATLIISADGEFPPKPVWDKKIDKWQKIMLNQNTASSPTGLMEMLMEVSGHSGLD